MPGLVEAHENVCFTFLCGPCNEFVGAICTVGEQEVAFFDMLQEVRCSAGIVPTRIAGHESFPSTMAEVDHAVDAHDGKAATLLLTRGLRVGFLIGLGVHELHRTAVDGLERESVPSIHRTNALS